MNNLENVLEALLFVSGNAIAIKDIHEKLGISEQDVLEAATALKERYSGVSGLRLLVFADKLGLVVKKPDNHRALQDIRGSIEELKEYIAEIKNDRQSK